MKSRPRSVIGRLAVVVLALAGATLPVLRAGAAASHDQIQGSGSSWASNAVEQWIADVQSNGLQVVFTASGSATGRQDFANRTNDFAVSDIGYQGSDPLTHAADTAQGRAFAYLPIVAGGTSFPYQIKSHGQLVRNLRLSGRTLAKIFTNQIHNWNDAQITADNNGRELPDLAIIPVVHSEGSGATAQFTKYLAQQYPQDWGHFAGSDVFTEYYPRQDPAIAQNGADGVINFVTSAAGNGAIGYDEYSYALGKNYPVASVENSAGYFVLPDQYNVAVALTQAKINQDKTSDQYLLQDLSGVYTYSDPRAYPLSSYSYGLIPTGANDPKMTTAKRQTLADYLFYSVCAGQKEMGPIGYSPLPINLVQASFDQVGLLKAADPKVDLTSRDVASCSNPTFVAGDPTRNHLSEIAPQPPACDKAGAGPCGTVVGNNSNGPPTAAPSQSVSQAPPSSQPSGPQGGAVTAQDGSPQGGGDVAQDGSPQAGNGSPGVSAPGSTPPGSTPQAGGTSRPIAGANTAGAISAGTPNATVAKGNSAGAVALDPAGVPTEPTGVTGNPVQQQGAVADGNPSAQALGGPINPSDVPVASIPYRLVGVRVVLIPLVVVLLVLALAQPSLLIGALRHRRRGD